MHSRKVSFISDLMHFIYFSMQLQNYTIVKKIFKCKSIENTLTFETGIAKFKKIARYEIACIMQFTHTY